jgi:hypothetical protein
MRKGGRGGRKKRHTALARRAGEVSDGHVLGRTTGFLDMGLESAVPHSASFFGLQAYVGGGMYSRNAPEEEQMSVDVWKRVAIMRSSVQEGIEVQLSLEMQRRIEGLFFNSGYEDYREKLEEKYVEEVWRRSR